MAKKVTGLYLQIAGDPSGALRALKSVQDRVKSFASGMATLGGALGVLGAGFSAFELVRKGKEMSEWIDDQAKLADRLGVSTQALRRMQYAGDLAGISADEMSGAIQSFEQQLGMAIAGFPKAQRMFQALGLEYRSLSREPVDKAFQRIAMQMTQLATPAERAAASTKLFGDSGLKLLNLFATGSGDMAAASREADQFGITVSRIDAGMLEVVNDNLTRMRTVLEGVGTQLLVQLAPAMAEVTDLTIGLVDSLGGIKPIVKDSFGWMLRGVAGLVDAASVMKITFFEVKMHLTEIGVWFAEQIQQIDTFIQKLMRITGLIPQGILPSMSHAIMQPFLDASVAQDNKSVESARKDKRNAMVDVFEAMNDSYAWGKGTASDRLRAWFEDTNQKQRDLAKNEMDKREAFLGKGGQSFKLQEKEKKPEKSQPFGTGSWLSFNPFSGAASKPRDPQLDEQTQVLKKIERNTSARTGGALAVA